MTRKIDIANLFDALGTPLIQALADRRRLRELEAENERLKRLIETFKKRLVTQNTEDRVSTRH